MTIDFILTGSGGCPVYGAYANRILSMSKGLQAIGHKVELIFAFNGQHNLKDKSGLYFDVPYKYLVSTKAPRGKIQKYCYYLMGIVKAIDHIRKHPNKRDLRIIACYHGKIANPIWLTCRKYNIPVVRELAEYPNYMLNNGAHGVTDGDVNRDIKNLKYFSGFIMISNALLNYYKRFFPEKPSIVIPINVQPERFGGRLSSPQKDITYVGTISIDKDGLIDLLHAFSIVKHSHPDIMLRLVGGAVLNSDLIKLKDHIAALDLENSIEFTGRLDRDEAIKKMLEAYILVLPRPDNTQAKGGFPTKLGEYLATGIPVMATPVGDIPLYLKHKENAYLAEPGNPTDMAAKLESIISDYDTALEIADNGKKLVYNEFNYVKQAYAISDYLRKL